MPKSETSSPFDLSPPLARIVALLGDLPATRGLVRVRGGVARGAAWCEISGRARDASWIELRLHHKPMDPSVQAGLLAYQPLSQGGRTIVVGEARYPYQADPAGVEAALAADVRTWLKRLEAVNATP